MAAPAEPDRLNSLYHLAPQLGSLWASQATRPRVSETPEAYRARLGRVYEEQASEAARLERETRHAQKVVRELEQRLYGTGFPFPLP